MSSNKRMQSDRSTRYASESAADASRYILKETMADVIKDEDVGRLVGLAKNFINANQYSPIEIINNVRVKGKCSLGEAKEAYVLAAHNESLGEYQERVILPLLDELEELDKQENND